jgi:lantibiotic leader peptide-processing serine protease
MRGRGFLGAVLALALAVAPAVVALAPTAEAGTTRTYIVLYRQLAVANDAAARVQGAGGTVVATYRQIGVVIARSSNDAFATTLKKDTRIQGVSATNGFGTQVRTVDGGSEGAAPVTSSSSDDTLSARQWDMDQIHAPEAHAITGGSPGVLVGDIDTGIDFTNPDLAANIDVANSANCVSGSPEQGTAAQDDNGHGTHTAGIIAAAENGIGIVGVAPDVKIAAIKAGNSAGFFFPEAVICAFDWAATHGVDVTNNSYFADPWYLNCKNDPEQRAIWLAEQRAIRFAISKGVVVVAAEGNFADDLAHPTLDRQSPDDTTPIERTVTNACVDIPAEIPGVVSVTADGNRLQKSFYSSYGMGVTDVIAPGGDSILFDASSTVPNGRVLSTWPQDLAANCAPSRRVFDTDGTLYCYQQGTSMAAPHAAGVAALIESQHPGISPGAVTGMLINAADPVACPTNLQQYAFFPSVNNDAPQVCTGGSSYNSFAGHGQVNALTAVGG